ncbi:MAG: hypothetical protein DHS20C17_18660 [Cyclobacteriaceae bacterium]|nr:MAG: hypothetical protein DHS20C17_18660 [Cyclobacteriaceae bacterium]
MNSNTSSKNRLSTLLKAKYIGAILQEYLSQMEMKNVRIGFVIGIINDHEYPYSKKSFRALLRNLQKNGNLRTHLPQAYQRKKKGAKRGYWYFTYVKNP